MSTLLNGRVHDWVSAILNLGPPIGKTSATLQSITYPSHGQETKLIYGSGPNPVGTTRDAYKPELLEVEFLASEWDTFRTLMGPGYGNVTIPAITISYMDVLAGLTPRTDAFLQLTVVKEQQSVAQGTDPLKTKVSFQPLQMVLNGVPYTLPTRV